METVFLSSPGSPISPIAGHHNAASRTGTGACDSPLCSLCRSSPPFLSSATGARLLRIPRRALHRGSGDDVETVIVERVALSALRTIEAPFADEEYGSDVYSVESARAWPPSSVLSPVLTVDAVSAELERLELERALGSADRVRSAMASTQRTELERARHTSRSQSEMYERSAAPAIDRQREDNMAREQRRRERRKAADDMQAALERDAAQSLQVLQALSDQSTATRRAALLEKQKAQQLQLQQLQRQQEQITQERQKLIEQQQQQERKQQQQQQQQAQQQQFSQQQQATPPPLAAKPAGGPTGGGIWAEFKVS